MKVKITDKTTKVVVTKKDTFDLSTTLAKIIIPSLQAFKEHKNGVPSNVFPKHCIEFTDEEVDYYAEIWNKYLDQMIEAFEIILADEFPPKKENEKKVKQGLKLFAEYYEDLWR